MNPPSVPDQIEVATRMLAQLNRETDEVRSELVNLRRNLADVQCHLVEVRATQLREANEHLVLAVLRAESIADNAIANLREMTRISQRDALTNTANRALMVDRLQNAITSARRRGTHFAVCFIDLDDFKQINDTLGHAMGDEVLQQAARRLQSSIRDSDTVSRYGGDEFLVLLPDVARAEDAARVGAKMLGAIAAPIRVDANELHLSASIGIALYPDDAEDAATLINRADAAMYRSKRCQRGGCMLYSEACPDPNSAPPVIDLPARPATPWSSAAAAHNVHIQNLREANERLVLAALTAQDLEARAEEACSRQVASFAIVAHELRSPLTPIQTAADLISRVRAGDPLLDNLQALIKGQVMHMTRLVDDLLDSSRAQTCKFQLELSTIEMADILRRTIATCRPVSDLKSQRLKVRLPRRRLPVHGDPTRLAQIFNNLLTNASKYTPRGGEIALTARALRHSIAITVADNGIGMTEEVLPHVFDLFVRDTHAVALDSRGLGIGLKVVRDLVEAHGGTVVASSAGRNLGSRFVVTLPMVSGQAY